MEVTIKKDLLFSIIKKTMNENRTEHNPSGNFVHPFSRAEAPIKASAHVPIISEEEPPVGDPDYVPASIRELKSAASRISQEVPAGQVEFFYRSLHKLLDAAMDKNTEGMLAESEMVNEAYTGEGVINILKEYIDDEDPMVKGPIEDAARKYVESDGMFDVYEIADELEQRFENLGYSISSTEIADKIMDAVYEIGATDTGDTGVMATAPTTSISKPAVPSSETDLDDDLTDVEDVPEERGDEMVSSIARDLAMGDESKVRDFEAELKKAKVFRTGYLETRISAVQERDERVPPLRIVASTVVELMDAVSRIIGTQTAIADFGYGGPQRDDADKTSGEASSWKGILNNDVNINPEVVYALNAKQKTPTFWKPRVIKFINKLGAGSAGSLSFLSDKFSELVNVAYDVYEEKSGLPIERFLDQVSNLVVEIILYSKNYGALTRNVPADEKELLGKLIDTGFTDQLKKEPFNVPNRTIFRTRNIDPEEKVEHAGREKSFRQAVIDAVTAYVIVKSDDFKKQRRALDADLEKEAMDAAIQKIIDGLSSSDNLSFTRGSKKSKKSFDITKEELTSEVAAFVDVQFVEAKTEYERSQQAGEEMSDEEIASYIDDESLSEEEKRARFTDEAASKIMRNTGSVASYRNYVTSVLNKKFDGAVKGLKDLDDIDTQDDVNYISIFNDTLGEVLPGIEKALISITRDLQAAGQEENLRFMANIIAEVRAIRELLYSDKTRGGEQFIQNLEGNIFTIGDEEVDALEFFSDGINSGPAILRYVVSDMIGATLKGNNKSIEGIDFSFEKKIKSTSEKAMKVAMKRFADMLGDLEQAQKSADDTAKELGVKSSKATFRDKKDPGVQVKVVYAYFGKLKKLPDFDKLNPAAKNYVCWFSYLADKVSQGDASMEEKVIVAKRMYDELGEYVAEITGRAVSQAKKDEKAASTEINKIMSEIEALEDFTQEKVKELNRDDEKMKTIVKKAVGLHLDDLDAVGITATEEGG